MQGSGSGTGLGLGTGLGSGSGSGFHLRTNVVYRYLKFRFFKLKLRFFKLNFRFFKVYKEVQRGKKAAISNPISTKVT